MKPRVMSLVIFTCVVGLLIAPNQVSILTASLSLLSVALGAGAAGALNMWYESDIDALMKRTCLRPIPTGKVSRNQALFFGILTSIFSIVALYFFPETFCRFHNKARHQCPACEISLSPREWVSGKH